MEPIIEVKDLVKSFRATRGVGKRSKSTPTVEAVANVSFTIKPNEIVSIVGESGSGKTTLGRLMVRLLEPNSGSIFFEGQDIFKMKSKGMLEFRRNVQMILQDPYDSLNPLYSIEASTKQPLNIFMKKMSAKEKRDTVISYLEMTGLRPAEEFLGKRPGELSGGQRQRVSIARALITAPKFIVADEPVSMLDVSLRAEILNTMKRLKESKGVSIMFITHDIATAKFMGDRILIFYKGTIVEHGKMSEVMNSPMHPYTKLLIDSVPSTNLEEARDYLSFNEEADIKQLMPAGNEGCRFADRCPHAMSRCSAESPHNVKVSSDHEVLCFLYG